jgi:hypothetical protein
MLESVSFLISLGVIIDQRTNPVDQLGRLVYDPKSVENLAIKFPDYAYLNGKGYCPSYDIQTKLTEFQADSYAWYATSHWFAQKYGNPDSSLTSATSGPDENYPDLFSDDGSINSNGTFDSPDYDEISADEAIAFAAGNYTPNGVSQIPSPVISFLGLCHFTLDFGCLCKCETLESRAREFFQIFNPAYADSRICSGSEIRTYEYYLSVVSLGSLLRQKERLTFRD